MSGENGDTISADDAAEVVVLLTGGLPSLKDASSFLNRHGISSDIMRPDDCEINS